MLENHCDIPASSAKPGRGHSIKVFAVNDDLTVGGTFKQVYTSYKCGLACAGHTDDTVDIPVLNGEGNVPERVHLSCSGVKGLADIFKFYHEHFPPR